MKILATSDWHPDYVTAGYPRFDDVARSARMTADAAIDEQVQLYLFAGDLCDPDRGRAHEAAALSIEIASTLSKNRIKSRWVVGNHDVLEDGTGTSTLEPLAAYAKADGGARIGVASRPIVEVMWSGLALVSLPYVARSHAYDPEAYIDKAAAFLNDIRHTGRVLVAGHLMLEGIGPGSETVDMARGRDIYFPVGKVLATWGDRAIMLNGHYHKRQIHRGVQVVGSLERITFDEEHSSPGYLILEVR